MHHDMMQGVSNHIPVMWITTLAVIVLVVAMVAGFMRRAPDRRLLITDIAGNRSLPWRKIPGRKNGHWRE